jgi:hypothetical protein
MSVCVSSALSGGLGGSMSLSHMALASSMMQPLNLNSHPMAPSMLTNHVPSIEQQQQQNQQHQQQQLLGGSEMDGPDHSMLLALIARNKALEGKCLFNIDLC